MTQNTEERPRPGLARAVDPAIAANLTALRALLEAAAARAAEAGGYMEAANRNAAIGTLLGLEDLLAEASGLQRAILALHRRAL
jgi:hypothetical protein